MHCRAGACPRRYLPGYSPGGTPARRAPPFLPEEMGGKKGRGAPPTLDPPIRGFMAAESCTDKARTGRASTPGSFFGFVTGAAAPWVARIGITPQALEVVALYRPGPPGRRRCHAAEGPGCPSQPAGNCSLCRGGYHPPACPRSRWPRGARQGELPQRGKRRCPGVQPGPPPVCPRNHWPRGARRPGAPFVYRGAPWRPLTGSPAPRGSPRAPSRTAPGSSPPQCTAAY